MGYRTTDLIILVVTSPFHTFPVSNVDVISVVYIFTCRVSLCKAVGFPPRWRLTCCVVKMEATIGMFCVSRDILDCASHSDIYRVVHTDYILQRLYSALPKTNAHLRIAHGPALCTSTPPGTVSAPPIAVPDGSVTFICGVGSMPPPLALPCFAFAERRLFASLRCFASKSSSLKPLSKQEPQHPRFPVSAS